MTADAFSRLVLAGLALTAAAASGCSIDEANQIADGWIRGTMFGTSFEAGPGAVTE